MRARWAGVDENIGTKMCWTLVDDNSGEIINRSIICSAIEPGAANLQVDPLEPLPSPVTPTASVTLSPTAKTILDDFMSLADFNTPLSSVLSPTDSIPDSSKSQVWQKVERGIIHGSIMKTHNKDISILPSPRFQNKTTAIQRDPRNVPLTTLHLPMMGSLSSLSISEIKGRSTYLCGSSVNSYFEMNLVSQGWMLKEILLLSLVCHLRI